jgi:hypothetical protein
MHGRAETAEEEDADIEVAVAEEEISVERHQW